jgi:hypothetical protein
MLGYYRGENMTEQERDMIHDYEALCIRSFNLADEMQIPLSFLGPSQMDTGYPEITIKKLRMLLEKIEEHIRS